MVRPLNPQDYIVNIHKVIYLQIENQIQILRLLNIDFNECEQSRFVSLENRITIVHFILCIHKSKAMLIES